MTSRLRIAFGGIHIECSTYNPVLTQQEDFVVLRGPVLAASPLFTFLGGHEGSAEFLPLLHARAVPGGPVSRVTYEALKAEFLARLGELGPVDGLYLPMHGAMYVEGMEDAEGDWISAARAVVGEACIVATSYDLHGNVSDRVARAIDIFSAYRTAPHIDMLETRQRAVDMLLRALQTGVRPQLVWVPIPVLMPGERSSTDDEPAKRLYASLPAIDAVAGVWDASLMVGYVWADEPRAGAAAVLTGTDAQVLAQQAAALATAYWQAREEFQFGVATGTLAWCVEQALASTTAPVVLADSGDNPTAGGVGDRADALRLLIAAQAQDCIVAGIADPAAVQACFEAGVGAELAMSIGAGLDASGSQAVQARVSVAGLCEAYNSWGRQALVTIGGIELVLSEKRRPYHELADFQRLGLDPLQARVVVVKSGYLSPELAPIANPCLMALSEGVVDQHIERLVRARKAVPTFPFDREFEYRPVPR
ncbi:M81 family metallopeptidase [Burkholderiaceae bacterium UC74_6]